MLLEPGVVGRALDREVYRQLQPVLGRGLAQVPEILQRAQLGVQRVVAAFLGADRVGAARVAGRGAERVVAALAVRVPDRVDRREIEGVEAHGRDARQVALHVAERAVAGRVVAERAGEDLIPARERGGLPLRPDRHRHGQLHGERAVVRPAHQLGEPRREQGVAQPIGRRAHGGRDDGLQRRAQRLRAARDRLLDDEQPLLHLQRHRHAGRDLLRQLVAEGREGVAPGLDLIAVNAEALQREARRPAVVPEEAHRRLVPIAVGIAPGIVLWRPLPAQHGGELVVPVADHVHLDRDLLADEALGREAAAVNARDRVLQGETRRLDRLGDGDRLR